MLRGRVDSFESLRELIILEQFKNSVPECIATYIGERGVKSVGEAAALADDDFLIHTSRGSVGPYETRANRPFEDYRSRVLGDSEKNCNYCHKREHWKNDCYALKSRPKQEIPRTNSVICSASITDNELTGITGEGDLELKFYLPFITEGFVSLMGSKEQVRIKILRDTGAFDSFILATTLPFSNDTFIGSGNGFKCFESTTTQNDAAL